MAKDFADLSPGQCAVCRHVAKKKDTYWVKDQGILHVICYNCGGEWVE